MLNDMEMIYHNLSMWQTTPDSRGKGGAHIHAYGFDLLRVGKPFQQPRYLFEPASEADFQHISVLQITQNCGIPMAFAHGKLVNPQKTGGRQGLLSLYVQSSLL
jgi:hypothetical protein